MTFWEEARETLPRPEIENLQVEALRRTVRRLDRAVPFYRRKLREGGIRVDSLKTVSDIRRLPFTSIEELRGNYPAGLLAVPPGRVVRIHTSSGTTGRPKAIFFSRKDIAAAAGLMARCLVMSGLDREDIVQNMMTYGLFTGALMLHYGAEKIGALVIPAGPGNSERQIVLMRDFRTTTLHFTPSYALHLAEVMTARGIEPERDLCLKRAFVGAEPFREETRRRIEDFYGIEVFNCYGLSEMNGPGVAFECPRKNGLHLWEDHFLAETVDPATGEALAPGEEGELVLTTLNREAMPLLRYRTRDLTRLFPEACACGRTHLRMAPVTGRTDDMFIVRGVNIFPQQIEGILMGISGVGRNYQIVLEEYDRILVRVEISRAIFDGRVEHLRALQAEIGEKLRNEIIVRPELELLEPGSLPPSEGKAVRVVDNRKM